MSESKDYPHLIEVLLVPGRGSEKWGHRDMNLLKKRFRSLVGKTSIKKKIVTNCVTPQKNVTKNISTIY